MKEPFLIAGLVCAFVAAVYAESGEAHPRSLRTLLGQTVPEAAFCTNGVDPSSLDDLAADTGVVLVFPAHDATEPAALATAVAKGTETAMVPGYIVLSAVPENPSEHVLVDCAGAARRAFGLDTFPETDATHTLLYIGPDRVIRRVESREPGQPIDLIFARVGQWREGKHVYDNYCARCHGPDGAATSYPNIKRLDGIGAALNEQEIIDNTRATAFVNIDALPREDREALAVFVASLPPTA